MRKVFMALAAGVAGIIAVFFAKAEGLITAEVVRESLVSALYVALSILSSWLITATVGTRHRAMAIGTGFGAYMGVQVWRTMALEVPFAPWQLFIALIVGISSPFLFGVSRAALARFGIFVKVNAETGAVEAIKIDEDETIWFGSPTIPDLKREGVPKEGPTVPKKGIVPEPSNE